MTIDIADYQRLERLLYSIKDCVEGADTFDGMLAGLEQRGYGWDAIREAVRPPVDADLHTHSNYSDGNLPPRKIAWLARLFGLRAVGITDHDSVLGVVEVLEEGQELGLRVVPGVELSTGRAGCEVLAYFPDGARFAAFLGAEAAEPFLAYLKAIQDQIHEDTVRIIDDVNAFLAGQGISQCNAVTVAELGRWFSGQEPYYPGTVAVLGLKRLPQALRDELGIHDPREFNTRVVSPALKKLEAARGAHGSAQEAIGEVFRQTEGLRRCGVRCITALAHPRELETKGKMRREEIEPFVVDLCQRYGLDGLEVNNSRDLAEDSAYWQSMAERIDSGTRAGAIDAPHELIRLCFSSDFHVLAPGLATGEITLGFGMLDESPEHRQGNLCACMSIDESLYQMDRFAR